MITLDRVVVEGHTSRGFEIVEAFADDFTRRSELGGACCAWPKPCRGIQGR